MNLPKLIYASLTGTLIIIGYLVGGWMHTMEVRVETLDTRLAATEQHYVAIQVDLQYLRQELQDMRQEQREASHGGR